MLSALGQETFFLITQPDRKSSLLLTGGAFQGIGVSELMFARLSAVVVVVVGIHEVKDREDILSFVDICYVKLFN